MQAQAPLDGTTVPLSSWIRASAAWCLAWPRFILGAASKKSDFAWPNPPHTHTLSLSLTHTHSLLHPHPPRASAKRNSQRSPGWDCQGSLAWAKGLSRPKVARDQRADAGSSARQVSLPLFARLPFWVAAALHSLLVVRARVEPTITYRSPLADSQVQ
ncbi:hypothetical protein BD289DRAFT_162521 [Coniella lustricola]|uniref:Uncharacterized protein n=1 Tax=Coniella lustricola TaxID=2025994 RepID=A0A2T2ZUD9_9PEZI|nr:hypothetical protein BD289DRAFT_162521 [Coniella lustricola]